MNTINTKKLRSNSAPKFLQLALCASLVSGCAQGFEADISTASLKAVDEATKIEAIGKPACVVETTDYEVDMRLLSFEITDKTNIKFGFNIMSRFFNALGLSVKTERGEMAMTMHLKETLKLDYPVADVSGIGKSKSGEFSFNLDALKLGAEFSYFYQTPLSKLTEKTLKSGLKNLRSDLDKVETPWTSRIVHTIGARQQVLIPAGSVAGLRLGDRFAIYNIDYIWSGEPCTSDVFLRRTTPTPLALVMVTQLEKNAALLTIVDKPYDEPIEVGSIVEVYELPKDKKEKARKLSRSVRVGNIYSELLSIKNSKGVDLGVYLEEQISYLLNDYGFYLRK